MANRRQDGWDEIGDEVYKGPIKGTLKITIISLVCVAIVSAAGYLFNIAKQPSEIIKNTLNAENIIYNYEWFQNTHQEVIATDVRIENSEAMVTQYKTDLGPRADWDYADKTEYSRLNTILLGLQNYRAELVGKYNARSKLANRKIFMGSNVPSSLD